MSRPATPKKRPASLEDRFAFIGDAVAPADRAALTSAIFEVEDRLTGTERTLKLWRKTGSSVDEDLRQLWRHEMRQVQRIMSYAGAPDVIVDVLEFVEDADDFGVVLERAGQPLSARIRRVSRQHWLRNLSMMRSRMLFWRNIRRIVDALGIVHAQGLVHGRLDADAIMTEGADEPDFRLSGFEWSLWISVDAARASATLGAEGAAIRATSYSFEGDWRALGRLIADLLKVELLPSGDFRVADDPETASALDVSEAVLLRQLIMPARMDKLDAESIANSIEGLNASLGRSGATRAGTFLLMFALRSGLGGAVFDASEGAIAVDEYEQQQDWIRAELESGVTLLAPKDFTPSGSLRLISNTMEYRLSALLDEDGASWDIAVCQEIKPRLDIFSARDADEHELVQPIQLVGSRRDALAAKSGLGPDVLDWSGFARTADQAGPADDVVRVRRALLLVQTVEAVTKALEIYPLDVLRTSVEDGRRTVLVRAAPGSDRDRTAKRLGLTESAAALHRLFEEDHRDADSKWVISQSAGMGAPRHADVSATFIESADRRGLRGYRFEVDDELPEGRLFLRQARDAGAEHVIERRLRNIKELANRTDLAAMMSDPWRVRRSSREVACPDGPDAAFDDLDKPKQEALTELWSTLPSFYVVGPPGVGKTRLATEVIRRRFSADPYTRMLVTAHGHDALDHLQTQIRKTLSECELGDIMMVRSSASENRPTSDEELKRATRDALGQLAGSSLAGTLPSSIRDRITELRDAAGRAVAARSSITEEDRSGLGALSRLLLDAANIVISTANSPDVEQLVEEREQFDWVVVEEAARATGPELVGALMLSGRRLLIGDHHQLPPFEADRTVKILADHGLVGEALAVADELVGSLMRDGELDELRRVASNATGLRETADLALRLFQPFRTFVEDDERKSEANIGHRRISATLTEQRRMDPAIARIVSRAFYDSKLETEQGRAAAAEDPLYSPLMHLGTLPRSPVVVVNFPHVSETGKRTSPENARPRYNNPGEVEAVIEILRNLRPREGGRSPSLAILSPYKAQVAKIAERLGAERHHSLAHLDGFVAVKADGKFTGTVDAFQGNEADVVILSLVRNNPRTGVGALGFLRDRRRMNVALSRAKSQLFIVGSLRFLTEAVRGIDPDAGRQELAFLKSMADVIAELTTERRGELPLARIISPAELGITL